MSEMGWNLWNGHCIRSTVNPVFVAVASITVLNRKLQTAKIGGAASINGFNLSNSMLAWIWLFKYKQIWKLKSCGAAFIKGSVFDFNF